MIKRLVSIIIVNHNHNSYLRACIESIQTQDYPHEVILVDNCSNDESVEFVKENFPFVKIIESKKNLGYGAGNNLGIKYTKGEYLVILNPDTIIEKDCLKELIEPLKKGKKLITTPKILLYDGSAINTCGNINHFTGLTFTKGFLAKSDDFQRQEYLSGFSGCCFAIKKRDFEELGGFDENFFFYNEDSDLSWRMHLKEFKILFVPTSVIRHDYTLKVPPEKIYHLEKGRYMILRKYLSWRDFLFLSPSLLVTESLTFGYVIRNGWKGLRCKLRGINDGLRARVDKVKGDKDSLFKSLSATIPLDQLTFNKGQKTLKTLANKIFKWNFRVSR